MANVQKKTEQQSDQKDLAYIVFQGDGSVLSRSRNCFHSLKLLAALDRAETEIKNMGDSLSTMPSGIVSDSNVVQFRSRSMPIVGFTIFTDRIEYTTGKRCDQMSKDDVLQRISVARRILLRKALDDMGIS